MDKNIVKTYNELTSRATYDKKNKTYYINIEDYHIFGLFNDTRRNKINRYAESLGVTLDIPYKNLPEIQGESLFEEYNIIKSILETEIGEEQRNNLEEKRIFIRNKIIEYNMELIKTIINRKLNNSTIETLNKNYDIEELYQMGYEYLLNYIDKHYLEKDKFEYTIKCILLISVKRKVEEQIGVTEYSSRKILKIREQLLEPSLSINELSSSLNLCSKKIEEFLTVCNINEPCNYKEIDGIYTSNNPLEDNVIYREQQENLLKILDTLPTDIQKRMIDLLYGFNGEKIHLNREIADIFEITESAVYDRKMAVLANLSSPLRSKYIKQIMGIDLSPNEENISLKDVKSVDKKILRQLEKFLIKQLDDDILNTITSGLSDKSKESLFIHLGYIEKKDNAIFLDYHYQTRKNNALDYIRDRITELYVIDNKNEEITNYLDFLMYYYLNKPKTKIRTR